MSRVSSGRKLGGLFIGLLLASLLLPTGVAIGGTTGSAAPAGAVAHHSPPTTPPACSYYSCYFDVEVTGPLTAGQAFTVTAILTQDGPKIEGCDGQGVQLSVSDEGAATQHLALVDGIVTFPVTIVSPGAYTLTVAFDDGYCDAESTSTPVTIQPAGVTVTCPANQICTARTESQSGNAEAAVTASAGATIVAAFSTLAQADYTACGGKQPADAGGVLTFDVQNGKVIKVLELTIDASIAGAKLKDHKVCWNAPAKFKTASGTWSAADPEGGFTGFLPDCLSKSPSLPCVLLRSKDRAGDVSLIVLAKPGDPKGYISK